MLNFLFDLATDPLGLPIPIIWEYVILSVIGVFAFAIGWEVSPGGPLGSLIHWLVRFIAFVIMWAVTYALIAVGMWLFG